MNTAVSIRQIDGGPQAVDTSTAQIRFSTFLVADRLYGIDVMAVQEVTMPLPMIDVPLAPPFVSGLINLRGQISTAIDMRELFGLENDRKRERMSVVCKHDDCLISLLIDQIGDVVEVEQSSFETIPESIGGEARKYLKGVHKLDNALLTVIDVKSIFDSVNRKGE